MFFGADPTTTVVSAAATRLASNAGPPLTSPTSCSRIAAPYTL
jgi:hypothetical protein